MNRSILLSVLWILAVPLAPLHAQRREEAVEVKVEDMEPTPYGVSVTLRAIQSDDELHIFIGLTEGEAIARSLRHVKPPRPMTHDLLKTILDRNGWRVQKMLIRGFSGDSYLADLVLEKNGETQIYDARPSDAMAIAVRYDAKLFVTPEVFEIQRQREQENPRQEKKPSDPETRHL